VLVGEVPVDSHFQLAVFDSDPVESNVVLDLSPGKLSIIHGIESAAGKKMIADKMSVKTLAIADPKTTSALYKFYF